jgi:hypothetical protein
MKKNELAPPKQQLDKTPYEKSKQFQAKRWGGKFLQQPILIEKQKTKRQSKRLFYTQKYYNNNYKVKEKIDKNKD